jgi:hypothetical protein
VIQVYPKSSRGDLDDIGEMDGEESIPPTSIETLEATGQKEPSPFSSKKVVHKSDTPHGTSNQAAEGTNSSCRHILKGSAFLAGNHNFLISSNSALRFVLETNVRKSMYFRLV